VDPQIGSRKALVPKRVCDVEYRPTQHKLTCDIYVVILIVVTKMTENMRTDNLTWHNQKICFCHCEQILCCIMMKFISFILL